MSAYFERRIVVPYCRFNSGQEVLDRLADLHIIVGKTVQHIILQTSFTDHSTTAVPVAIVRNQELGALPVLELQETLESGVRSGFLLTAIHTAIHFRLQYRD